MKLFSKSELKTGVPHVSTVLGDLGTYRRLGTLFVVVLLFLGAGDNARVDRLGRELICMCGCNQTLVGCNHLNCPYRGPMTQQLTTAVDRGDSDKMITQFFVQTYGTLVLAAPTNRGFDRIAWIMPFLALLGGITLVVLIVWNWRKRSAPIHASVPPPVRGDELARFREQARREADL
jgi:cytochrome c-type biogenesis protein CcmH/NrfF